METVKFCVQFYDQSWLNAKTPPRFLFCHLWVAGRSHGEINRLNCVENVILHSSSNTTSAHLQTCRTKSHRVGWKRPYSAQIGWTTWYSKWCRTKYYIRTKGCTNAYVWSPTGPLTNLSAFRAISCHVLDFPQFCAIFSRHNWKPYWLNFFFIAIQSCSSGRSQSNDGVHQRAAAFKPSWPRLIVRRRSLLFRNIRFCS